MTKTLLIGQGIAGTLLAWSLRKRGCQIHIADGNLAGDASSVAAGIINPVTGKRFVKSWRFDEFFPLAKEIYQQLELELGIQIWEERPTLRLLATPEEVNDWAIRCTQPDYAYLLGESKDAGDWWPFLKPGFRFGIIRQSARANLPALVSTFREKAKREGIFLEKSIDYQEIETLLQEYDRVIFCEGWRAERNPFFPEAQFRVSKGEALIIQFQDLERAVRLEGVPHVLPTEMLKKTMLLAPMGDGTFWAGSTYRWHFEDTLPSAEGRDYILGYLHGMFDAPFEIVGHVSGIRPTMIDRRPLVEQSKLNPKVFVFNGLGTKGALLAPFFAEQLAGEICNLGTVKQ